MVLQYVNIRINLISRKRKHPYYKFFVSSTKVNLLYENDIIEVSGVLLTDVFTFEMP